MALSRIRVAYRPKTQRSYDAHFRSFLAFCICMKISVYSIEVVHILSFMEFLVGSIVSVAMVQNHLSAIRAKFLLYDLNSCVLSDQRIRLYVKSLKINRPLVSVTRHIMTVDQLKQLSELCGHIYMGPVYRAIFLVAFFGFLHLLNMAPHSQKSFDPSRHITAQDVYFTSTHLKINLKWSKMLQTMDKAQTLTLPKLVSSILCPYRALKHVIKIYKPLGTQPLFQVQSDQRWLVLTDSKVRKCLSRLNVSMGLPPHHFTFHSFRRSGATLAYNAHIPIQHIKRHGSWTLDCVWTYIQQDQSYGEGIAEAFSHVLADA